MSTIGSPTDKLKRGKPQAINPDYHSSGNQLKSSVVGKQSHSNKNAIT